MYYRKLLNRILLSPPICGSIFKLSYRKGSVDSSERNLKYALSFDTTSNRHYILTFSLKHIMLIWSIPRAQLAASEGIHR